MPPAATTSAPRFTSRIENVRLKTPGSLERYQRSQRSLAGGVSSSLRRSMKPYPLFFRSGQGARVQDVDGNTYIDYGLAWGPLILGHAHPEISAALSRQSSLGTTFGAQCDLEFEVAEHITATVPCADLVCFANSGTEIVQVALRLARAITGRSRFLKFEGHYHGWDDSVMVSYQPTAAQIESANGAPVPIGLGRRPSPDPVVVSWNDLEAVKQAFATSDDIAAIICEPLLCNCFCIPPAPGFLNALRELATRNGALLIFDEVITGYRIALGGAQELYGVTPDLATLGKAVGAGMPLSVLAGRREYMDAIVRGDVIHAGTLNGNPLTLSVADVALRLLRQGGSELYARLTRLAASLREGLEKELRHRGFMVVTSGEGAVFHLSFMESPASNYRDTLRASRQLYSEFAAALLDEGVLALPDGRWYISTAHDEEAIDRTLDAVRRLLA